MRPLTIKLLSVRRSLPVFLAVVVCLAFWQVWLTWRLMEQDRNLSAQQARERLEQIADLAVAQLGGALDGWELGVRDLDTLPPPAALNTKFPLNGTLVLLTQHSVTTCPHKPLLFVPDPPSGSPASEAFDGVEKLEFRDQNYSGAIAVLRPLIDQPATRAEALLRSARLERRLNHSDAALADYDRLVRETSVNADGVPYALLASGARCELLPPGSARTAELQHLRTALSEGRWPLPHESFDYHWAEVNRLSHTSDTPPKNAAELSSLAALLHKEWQRSILTGASLNDREESADGSLLIWHATPSRLAALSAPTGWLDASLKLPAQAGDIRWRLLGSSEAASSGSTHIIRSLAEAHLAGKLEFSSLSVGVKHGLNRALWLTGVALMLLLVLAGAYAMHRGVSRELRVAVLQSDFVSAVSHEFRSPLTTLRSISELLVNNRISNESRLQQSYVFLERETARLQKLVEDLLDFGRMESGRKQYSIAPHDVFTLVRAAVADFRDEALGSGFEVDMNLDARAATVKADEEALRRAIRNLLENAQKYSPECRTVWVEGRVNHSHAMISVRDKGMGIDPREQPQIFQKFVRGAAAKKAGIKGTGIGLSMVHQIVQACGGDVRVESAVGAGSTFTILLPLIAERENGA